MSSAKHRILVRPANFAECRIRRQHMFQQRIVIEQVNLPRCLTQRLIEIGHDFDQSNFGERVEEIKHNRFSRKNKFSGITTQRLKGKALLRVALVDVQVFLRHTI